MIEDDGREEMVMISDDDGDTRTDTDPCGRSRCNCPRHLHEDGTGACSGCGDCPRFIAS
jgi:hypothetical protein